MLVGLVDDLFNPTGAADGEAHYGNVLGFASGNGGNGGAGGPSISGPMPDGDGGQGQGGSASLWSNSLVTASSVTFFANGNGGNGGNGGSAFGGSARITSNDAFIDLIRVDGLIDIAGNVTLEAAAAGGNGSSGATGNASGGTAELQADGGDVTIGGDVFLSADGDAEDGAFGGQGQGGLHARVDAYDGASRFRRQALRSRRLEKAVTAPFSPGAAIAARRRFAPIAAHPSRPATLRSTRPQPAAIASREAMRSAATPKASALEDGSQLTVTGLATVKANGTGGTGTIAGAGGSGWRFRRALLRSR